MPHLQSCTRYLIYEGEVGARCLAYGVEQDAPSTRLRWQLGLFNNNFWSAFHHPLRMKNGWLTVGAGNRISCRINFVVCVCPEIVAHPLDEIRRKPAVAVAIEVRQGRAKRWNRHTELRCGCDHMAPIVLRFFNHFAEIWVNQQVRQIRVAFKCFGDEMQEMRPNDTTAPPS